MHTSVCLRFSEIAYIFNVGPNTVFPEETVEELNHGHRYTENKKVQTTLVKYFYHNTRVL